MVIFNIKVNLYFHELFQVYIPGTDSENLNSFVPILYIEQDVQQCKLEHSQKMEAIKKSHDLQLIRLVHDANVEKASAETKLNLGELLNI